MGLDAKEYRLSRCHRPCDGFTAFRRYQAHFQYATEMAPLVCVDFGLFCHAIKNLLDNALKHTTGRVEDLICVEESISVCSFGENSSRTC